MVTPLQKPGIFYESKTTADPYTAAVPLPMILVVRGVLSSVFLDGDSTSLSSPHALRKIGTNRTFGQTSFCQKRVFRHSSRHAIKHGGKRGCAFRTTPERNATSSQQVPLFQYKQRTDGTGYVLVKNKPRG